MPSQINTNSCSICFIEVAIPKMREHIARHIILEDLVNNANTCGYCGNDFCNIEF